MENYNYIGNGSTIIKFLATAIAGWAISLAIANGFDLGVDQQTLAEILGIFIGLGFGYIDAKFPNTFNFLGNQSDSVDVTDDAGEDYA